MKNFKNILVVFNKNDDLENNPALKKGLELATMANGQLTLMAVISPPKQSILEYKGIFKPEELTKMFVDEREKQLASIAKHADHSGINIDTKVAVGKDFIEIIRQMVLNKHDILIKMANPHEHGFDSSDFHLMRKSPQPVWLLKNQNNIQNKTILAAIDLSLESSSEGKELNRSILNLAACLAVLENREVSVLSCWSFYGEESLRDNVFLNIPNEEIDTLIRNEEQANQKLQDHLVQTNCKQDYVANIKFHQNLEKGNPTHLIPQFVNKHGIGIVVMGTVGRTGIPGLLIGNTSESILHKIDSSVITLKPSGFESIIR